ncbi:MULTISPECIES: NUDIX hydrolase [Paenibacillus]|uniref:NUDIX hydrolase n=1 Tax=Paenibacillus residui TaxID=629724 RepID=A0ABW3DAF9_9BACL
MRPTIYKKRYPNLFQTNVWGQAISQFDVDLPPEPLISNVNIVPFLDDEKCILIRLDNGNWEMPGETLEPDEHYQSALMRELMEEAGARLVSPFIVFGAWRFVSSTARPYRPHLPHPIYYRAVGYGDVELVSAPLIPEDGEMVVAVEAMTLQEAKQQFMKSGRADLAELYELAYDLRNRKVNEDPIG